MSGHRNIKVDAVDGGRARLCVDVDDPLAPTISVLLAARETQRLIADLTATLPGDADREIEAVANTIASKLRAVGRAGA